MNHNFRYIDHLGSGQVRLDDDYDKENGHESCLLEKKSNGNGKKLRLILYVKVLVFVVLVSILTSPLGMMSDVNEELRREHGNPGSSPYIDVICQNVPGTTSSENIKLHLEIICRKYRPSVIVVTESSTERVQHVSLDGYTWYRGNKLHHKEARVSLFVQTGLPHEDLDLRHC